MPESEFRIMSYNILKGGQGRLESIGDVVREHEVDFLAIQEANGFSNADHALLRELSQELGLPHYDISLAGEKDYHVASLSRWQLTDVRRVENFRNACLAVSTESSIGEVTVCNTHLTPYTEDERVQEISLALQTVDNAKNAMVVGDLNSLSPHDAYDESAFHPKQRKKFFQRENLQHAVINTILSRGYLDLATLLEKNDEKTVPTTLNADPNHSTPVRIDYLFASAQLARRVKEYKVIKTRSSNVASDHFPVLAVIGPSRPK